jgi:hypothetical protein
MSNWEDYTDETNKITYLKELRDWVEVNKYGFGDRPLYYMWYLLLKDLDNIKLAEIGVYKGQTLALWALIGKKLKKNFNVYGISPLTNTKDPFHEYEAVDYKTAVEKLHNEFKLKQPTLIKYYSQDKKAIEAIKKIKPIDVLYIDGAHTYSEVVGDILNYIPFVKEGGLVVMDDASCLMPNITHWFKGLEQVSWAVEDTLAKNRKFEEVMTVGHNRVFRKK